MTTVYPLLNTELFTGLTFEEIDYTLKSLRFCEFRQGEYIFNTGEQAHTLYLLETGLVKVSHITPDGDAKILELCETGAIFGELFLGKNRFRVGQAQAMEDCTTYRLNEQDLYHLIQTQPQVGMNFIRHLVDAQRQTLSRMHALLRADAKSRLLGTLLYLTRHMCGPNGPYFELNPAITQQDLADMAGLNRSTVSSLINRLRDDKVLGGSGRSLKIDIQAVEALLWQAGFELLR